MQEGAAVREGDHLGEGVGAFGAAEEGGVADLLYLLAGGAGWAEGDSGAVEGGHFVQVLCVQSDCGECCVGGRGGACNGCGDRDGGEAWQMSCPHWSSIRWRLHFGIHLPSSCLFQVRHAALECCDKAVLLVVLQMERPISPCWILSAHETIILP